MRITSIELAGTSGQGEQLARAFAELKMSPAAARIEAEVHLPDGRTAHVEIPIQDLRAAQAGISPLARRRLAKQELWKVRNAACEQLADLLDGDPNNAKSYLAIIEQMAALA